MNFVYVGLGGAIGAISRYAISLIPYKGDFPFLTLITNVIGAFLIGIIAAIAVKNNASHQMILFIKTGICGGFTTFSTFSLESFNLFSSKRYLMGTAYIIASVLLCIAAVYAGGKVIDCYSQPL